ncbi:MAG: alkaline phosphatase, partial [Luteolibacter sp.]
MQAKESIEATIGRRSWLKSAGLLSAASFLSSANASATEKVASAKKVRGVVFMISDGMSPGVLSLAEAYSQLTRQRSTEWWKLVNNPSAARGLMDTASANSLVTDSAAASSAWGGGQRVNNGAINVDPSGKEITPIAALLRKKNAAVGLVTTATVTHATPAGFAASIASRNDEQLIAPQYLERVDIVLGGGSGFFDAKKRDDKRDLSDDFKKSGYEVISHRDQLLASKSPKLLGTFAKGHLPFSIDRAHDAKLAASVPSLVEMTEAALGRFLASDKPFLLQVEGARIDHAAHLNDIGALLGDQLAFDDTLAAVLAMTAKHDDILVVVTSDHGNSNPGLNGMGDGYKESNQHFGRISRCKASHERIFNQWNATPNGNAPSIAALVEKQLGFHLKKSEAEALVSILHKENVVEWNHQLEKPEGLLGQFAGNHTGIGWTGTTHTSDPTLLSAIGPQSSRFSGIIRN